MVIVGEFVGGAVLGAAFGVLFDVVKKAVDKPTTFKSLLQNIKFSLEFLKPVIEKIGEHNVELGLPDEEIKHFITEMEEGAKHVQKSSKVSKWNCMKSYYTNQLIELDGTLKRLFQILMIQGVRDAKETLILVRNHQDQFIETAKDAKETLVMAQKNSSQLTESVKDGKETLELARKYAEQSARDGKETLLLARKTRRLLKQIERMVTCTSKELKIATRNFSPDVMIGEGGFGRVFKGWLDKMTLSPSKPDTGMAVAIKKLKQESLQGIEEWQTEVNFSGRLSHPNIVKLLGYCWEKKELLLVYEFMPKGSLQNHLFRRISNLEPLSWETRIKVAIGAAQGLAFLHSLEKQVIFRDFKTSHVLLDRNYTAKLSDFGLAKLGPNDGNSHVSTRVVGTYGYAAPEYLATGHLNVKSDVYSFGVVLLEILTGLRVFDTSRPKEQVNLVYWAKPFLSSKKKLKKVMDVRMEGQYSLKAAFKAGQLTLNCLASELRNRPCMKEVVEELEQILAIKKQLSPTSR